MKSKKHLNKIKLYKKEIRKNKQLIEKNKDNKSKESFYRTIKEALKEELEMLLIMKHYTNKVNKINKQKGNFLGFYKVNESVKDNQFYIYEIYSTNTPPKNELVNVIYHFDLKSNIKKMIGIDFLTKEMFAEFINDKKWIKIISNNLQSNEWIKIENDK